MKIQFIWNLYFFLFCQSSYLFFPYTEIRWIAWWNCYNLYFYTSTGADTGNVTISPNSFPYLDERTLRWLSPCIIWEPENYIINIYINDLYIMSYHSKIKNLGSSILDKIHFLHLTNADNIWKMMPTAVQKRIAIFIIIAATHSDDCNNLHSLITCNIEFKKDITITIIDAFELDVYNYFDHISRISWGNLQKFKLIACHPVDQS